MGPESEALANWKELMRRMRALGETGRKQCPEQGFDLVEFSVPPGDPTGFLELAETMKRQHIQQGLELAERFPFFESLFCPIIPGRQGWAEAETAVENLLRLGLDYVAPLARGSDYEIFHDVAGEVTAFHFATEQARGEFRRALGLPQIGGFEEFCRKNFGTTSGAEGERASEP